MGTKKAASHRSSGFSLEKKERPVTPNPFYHYQKRKLILKYKQQLVEEDVYEQQDHYKHIMSLFEEMREKNQQRRSQETKTLKK